MKKLGKKVVKTGGGSTVTGYCDCKCTCTILHPRLNASNAAPTWIAVSLIEPAGV